MRPPFRQRLQPESRQRLLRAAGARLADGDVLWQQGHRAGAIYLWGYAAEIWLKTAFFRHVGLGLTQPVTTSQMRQYLAQFGIWGSAPRWSNLHDVVAWSRSLISLRQSLGRPMGVVMASQLSACSLRIADAWSETIRYHGNQAWPNEAVAFRRDVAWIETHRRVL
jgi:hypothetical protein